MEYQLASKDQQDISEKTCKRKNGDTSTTRFNVVATVAAIMGEGQGVERLEGRTTLVRYLVLATLASAN